MDASLRRVIGEECRDLVARYAHDVDHGAFANAADLFAPDGGLSRGGKLITGREALIELLTPKPPEVIQRHVCGTCVIDVVDQRNARGVTYYIVYRQTAVALPARLEAPVALGEWRDEFVLTPQGWRFGRRDVVRVFAKN